MDEQDTQNQPNINELQGDNFGGLDDKQREVCKHSSAVHMLSFFQKEPYLIYHLFIIFEKWCSGSVPTNTRRDWVVINIRVLQ